MNTSGCGWSGNDANADVRNVWVEMVNKDSCNLTCDMEIQTMHEALKSIV